MAHILIASHQPEALAPFLAALAEAGCRVDLAPSAKAAQEAVRHEPPTLCLVDGDLPDMTALALVSRLIEINACVTSAVVSPLTDEAFHEAGEGLGILMRLSPGPGPNEARTLLATLTTLGG
ncbi:response regulator [Desulfovibrio sp. TomC]|uniref:response regulator n=1 Tax=Desulfovibrio sp. TomC TaxID=1562888 RepID=UPI000573977B|nr:response regulator [Desulfovibrio sp. TomC]KHK03826.1 hypothetical protein NY78_0882 [Desulfovibrio sp. TomC]